jgi:hypothetical protein
LALRWTGDDVRYEPSSRRMPIHYRHSSAFPRILPAALAQERNARLQAERPATAKLLGSAWNNMLAAARLRFGERAQVSIAKQTWFQPPTDTLSK